jgi:hypothetical protein
MQFLQVTPRLICAVSRIFSGFVMHMEQAIYKVAAYVSQKSVSITSVFYVRSMPEVSFLLNNPLMNWFPAVIYNPPFCWRRKKERGFQRFG